MKNIKYWVSAISTKVFKLRNLLIIIFIVLSVILVTRFSCPSNEQTKFKKGKEIVLSTIASLPFASGAVRQYDAIQLDKQLSVFDSNMRDLYIKVEELSGESKKKAIIDAIGQIKVLAGTGSIEIEGVLLEALNKITVNSQQGIITTGDGTVIKASQIRLSSETGGELTLTDTVSETNGTRIDIGKEAQIKIKGDAKIDQK